jgi:hypothetical protein
LDAFLDGYAHHRRFELDLLAGSASIRVRDFHARAAKAGRTPRIAGMPVRMERVERLYRRLRDEPAVLTHERKIAPTPVG